ncbi:MAG TPA: PPC domain-containing protein [Kribbella sp.]|uniref:PPC domain-containing protein n=1 Tax=Kribbella sp. TaxID=1871183 RepID=UPI002D78301A|nr:PPC domain-containing protein [Kribbella sp.]HET6295560.1 PPC domain-containing protein [Kribbella sp.]
MKPQFRRALVGVASIALLGAASAQSTAAVRFNDQPSPREKQLMQAGVQLAPKSTKAPTSAVNGKTYAAPNPMLANTPDATTVDWAYWHSRLAAKGKLRAAEITAQQKAAADNKAAARALPSPLLHDELEPATLGGTNDSLAAAERINGFGTANKENPRLRILGTLPDLTPSAVVIPVGTEDNGSLPLATDTGIGTGSRQAVETTGTLGDGRHGPAPAGDGSNDFDVYKLNSRAGDSIVGSTDGTSTDTVAAVYNSAGVLVAFNDDISFPGNVASRVGYDVPADGTYYVLIGGFALDPLPADPNDSGSGAGGAQTGPYEVAINSSIVDKDYYAFKLRKGDVLGGSVTGAATRLRVWRPDGVQAHGSEQDASSLYPVTSPLPAGGNAVVAYVAEEPGWYALSVESGIGDYDATVEVYRSGTETDKKQQTVFLDFDGARVNTAIWGGPGVRQLSPFSAFIARWGLPRSAENQLINQITNVVTENLKKDLIAKGLNPNVAVRILNSRDNADPFGQENVSRVIVGGTIDESGIATIGVAQYIDPGNYGHEDSAVVLLDVLSDPTGASSINTYLTPQSNRIGFVSQVVGNVVSHEVGHMIGSYHVDQFNTIDNLMDQGGNPQLLFGVGPDNIGGTADDVDVDFGEDVYNPNEGFTGIEDTLNVSAWALSKPKG